MVVEAMGTGWGTRWVEFGTRGANSAVMGLGTKWVVFETMATAFEAIRMVFWAT
jgi:hypothetical protein